MKYYKFLTADNRGTYSKFDFSKYLESGEWLPEIEGDLEFCERGYHACTSDQLLDWLEAQLWEVEYKDEPAHGDDKVNGRCVRFVRKMETWNDRTARLFAVWCAREALKLVDDPDPRSVEVCNVAERYANGEADDDDLDAAGDAASAARDTAWAAALDAAWAASRAASRAAALDAAWAASRDAAWDAAWDTAWAAAWDTAWAAALDAARDAAWDASRDAQLNKLKQMLGIDERKMK